MTTAAALSRRLSSLEYTKDAEVQIFIIDNLTPSGPIEYSKQELERRKAEAVARDPNKGIYIIDFTPNRDGWMA